MNGWLERYSRSRNIPFTIARSAPISTRPASVLANQNQSASLSALLPIREPTKPIFQNVAMSSAMAFKRSSRTGGGACRKRCIRVGEESVAAEEKGTEVSEGEMMCINGVSQLKRIRFFLRVDDTNYYQQCITQQLGTDLVSDKCPIAAFIRRTISPPRGALSTQEDLAWASKRIRIEYCIIF